MTHYCHAIDCQTPVPPHLVMCIRHWGLVPSDVQRSIWGAYRKGQERDKRPSQVYLYHQWRAVMHVALQEGRVTLPDAVSEVCRHAPRLILRAAEMMGDGPLPDGEEMNRLADEVTDRMASDPTALAIIDGIEKDLRRSLPA